MSRRADDAADGVPGGAVGATTPGWGEPILEIAGLVSGYGGSRVLDGTALTVRRGGVLALLGRNGVGKTTLVMTVAGLVPARGGSIRLDGEEITGLRPDQVARRGVGLVPQGRRIFAPLTVDEHLRVVARGGSASSRSPDAVYETFPALAARRAQRAGTLSGGEQEMLAIARALVRGPRLLLLDEPSDGLSPTMIDTVAGIVQRLCASGVSILLVEQNLRLATRVSERVAVMVKGKIAYETPMAEFRLDDERVRSLLGVG